MNPTSDAIPDATWDKFVASVEPPAAAPAAEPAAPAASVVVEPAAVPAVPAGAPEPAAPTAPVAAPAAPDLLEAVAGLDEAGRAKLREALGVKPEPVAAPAPPPKFEPSAEVAALLNSADPDDLATGKVLAKVEERAWKAEQRADAAEARAAATAETINQRAVEEHVSKLEDEFNEVQSGYVIDEKPVSDDQLDAVAAYMKENPSVARALSPEQVLRALYPSARKAPAPGGRTPGIGTPVAPAPAPPAPASQPPVATIVPAGSAGGMTPGPDAKPRAGMSMEEAVARGCEAYFGTRGRSITHT